ncbi:uncharacterized protein LOC124363575 [Homalodisca vitripennis]|uniref:uncharacterized protein LOC124363575 n=1 Tax=Homalodisca vitripennis TaxID=197043 RepID=UPI001EEA6BDF|nr:uncharacterized protein LOC124363575 [Homalodisca vitripennis]
MRPSVARARVVVARCHGDGDSGGAGVWRIRPAQSVSGRGRSEVLMQWQCVHYDGDHLVPLDWDLDLNLELTADSRTKLHRYLSEGHNELFRTMHPPRRSTTMTFHDRSALHRP